MSDECTDCTALEDENQRLAIRLNRLETALRDITRLQGRCLYGQVNWQVIGQAAVRRASEALIELTSPIAADEPLEPEPAQISPTLAQRTCKYCPTILRTNCYSGVCTQCRHLQRSIQSDTPEPVDEGKSVEILTCSLCHRRIARNNEAGLCKKCRGNPPRSKPSGFCPYCKKPSHGHRWCVARVVASRERAKQRKERGQNSPRLEGALNEWREQEQEVPVCT